MAQLGKCWPADLADVSSSLLEAEIFPVINRFSIAHSFSLSPSHHPDMTKLRLKTYHKILNIRTDSYKQTVQIQEQSDQGLHCLPFHLYLADASLVQF